MSVISLAIMQVIRVQTSDGDIGFFTMDGQRVNFTPQHNPLVGTGVKLTEPALPTFDSVVDKLANVDPGLAASLRGNGT